MLARRNNPEALVLEISIEGQGFFHSFGLHHHEAGAIDQAELAAVVHDKTLYCAPVKIFRDPVNAQQRCDSTLQVMNGFQTESMLKQRARLDEHVVGGHQGAPE